MKRFFLAVLIVLLNLSVAWSQDVANVFVITQADGKLDVEKLELESGTTKVFICGGDSKYVDVVFPPAPGGSASLAQSSNRRILTATNRNGQISISDQTNGKLRQLPALSNPDQFESRVSITSSDGQGKAFIVSRFRDVKADNVGPVIDMFAGRVPVNKGNYIICTDTYSIHKQGLVSGTVPLELDRYYFVKAKRHDGESVDFILDTGAATTVVDKSFLSEEANIQETKMVQYSAAGKKLLKYSPGGATGKVTNVLGHATLKDFQLGDVDFGEINVAVMDRLPDIFGRPVAGIIGIDLLQRANFAKFSKKADGKGYSLVLSDHTAIELAKPVPYSLVRGHMMIPIRVAEKQISVIVDTGAPFLLLDEIAAQAVGAKPNGESRAARGIDKGSSIIHSCTVNELQIGGEQFEKVSAKFGALAVFAPLNVHNQLVGLLGNEQVSQFPEWEIDFSEHVIRFKQRR